jgi:hypothetical protein
VAVEEDEPDEAVAEGRSSEHERWWRGGVMEAKNGGGLSSARGRIRHEGARERGGEGAVRAGGALRPFIGAEGALGRGGRGGNGRR